MIHIIVLVLGFPGDSNDKQSAGNVVDLGLIPGLDYCDIEWFALEINRDYSAVFEIASKYGILDSFVAKCQTRQSDCTELTCITFILCFISVIRTSCPPQTIRH